jgi:hypothetical protein
MLKMKRMQKHNNNGFFYLVRVLEAVTTAKALELELELEQEPLFFPFFFGSLVSSGSLYSLLIVDCVSVRRS